jgi:CRP/FNR family transcriptional regulator
VIEEELLNRLTRRFAVLARIAPECREMVRRRAEPLKAAAGTQLFGVGDCCPGFAALDAGVARAERPLQTGRTILLYRVRAGQSCVLSLAALLADQPSLARVVVEEDAAGALLPVDAFNHLVEQSREFRAFVFRTMTERLAGMMNLIEAMATQPLHKRVAALLLQEPKTLAITHRGIAEELGSVREVISRILGDFERRGMVELQRGRIHVVNRGGLEKMIDE